MNVFCVNVEVLHGKFWASVGTFSDQAFFIISDTVIASEAQNFKTSSV